MEFYISLESTQAFGYTRGARMEEPNGKKRDISPSEAIGITWDILATVLILTTLFALGGVMADRYFGTRFIFTALGFILLAIIGYRIIIKKAKKVAKRIEESGKETDTHP
jgi:F0F1-type ATP synthase assembly protein I